MKRGLPLHLKVKTQQWEEAEILCSPHAVEELMSDYDDDMVEFDCELKSSTDMAYLVVIDEDDFWVPKSVGHFTPRSPDKVYGLIEVPTWWAKDNALA